jgi:hypothetical protein
MGKRGELKGDFKYGPEGADKIGLLGSAPSSLKLAPYGDLSWSLWGCSPGVYGMAQRADVWFEIHRWEPPVPGKPNDPGNVPWMSPEYVEFMRRFHGPVLTAEVVDELPTGLRYPFEYMLEKHGPYHFTSSLAWMLALAIECKPKAIGLWGVDMAANTEYAFQRPGCQHFIGLAMNEGIDVILPPESDLMRPTTLYGVSEYNPRFIKLLARKREFEQRIANANNQATMAANESHFMRGALDNLEYILQSWVDDIPTDLRKAVSKAKTANPAYTLHQREAEPAHPKGNGETREAPKEWFEDKDTMRDHVTRPQGKWIKPNPTDKDIGY